jgi:fructose-bisphosphate aldolase, class II
MPLVPTTELLSAAVGTSTGLAAFNVIHLETAEALVGAAEDAGAPLVLQISENCVRFHGGLRPIAAATAAVAASSSASIALHLDHAEDERLALAAVELGFGSVMFDGARLPFAQNIAATRRVVAAARARGVAVEAELGEIGGKDGAHAPGVRTDPDEAARFVAETRVDALAVAVGSSHAMATRTARLDLDLIRRLHAAVDVPLVLHGSSGVPDRTMREAVRAGITKVNVSTQLNRAFTDAVREYLDVHPDASDSRKYVECGRAAMRSEAARLIAVIDVVLGAQRSEVARP